MANIVTINTNEQIFSVKQNSLYEINALLGLRNMRAKSDNARQIIRTLYDKYRYTGEYNTRYIREFLKIYNMKIDNDIQREERELLLFDLSENVDDDGNYTYYVDDARYKQLINPKYRNYTRQNAEDAVHQQQEKNANNSKSNIEQSDDNEQELLQVQPINNTANQIFPNDKMANTEKFPKVTFANGLANLRRQSTARIGNINQVDLQNLRNTFEQRRRNINPNLKPRSKKNKYGITGMDDLINVVVRLKNDVKQIKDAQSMESAQDWVDRHGYRDIYDVVSEDIDGDNIPEVIVQDKLGKKVIVNGYTTEPSLFPYRNRYYATHPTRESRKNHPWKNYIRNEFYNPTYDATGRLVTSIDDAAAQFDNAIGDAGYTKHMKPHARSSYQAFTAKCITPFYQALKYLSYRGVPFKLTQLAAYIWKEIVRDPALTHVYGPDVLQIQDKKELTKLCNQREIKDAIESIVVPYLTNPESIFYEILPVVIDAWRQHGYNMDSAGVRDFILVAYAIVNNPSQLPPRNNFEAWKIQALEQFKDVQAFVERIASYHEE